MIFINYAKLKRKMEVSVSNITSSSVIPTEISYNYDNAGNPINVAVNSGTQEIQNLFISRDNTQRTRRIQYTGYVKGLFERQLEQNDYNTIRESNKIIVDPFVVSKLIYEKFIKQGICVPAYFRDKDSLDQLVNTYNDNNIDNIAIINLANGPDDTVDDTVYNFVETMKNINKDVYGYVYSSYGDRALETVSADIKQWLELYPSLKGFFIDEVSNDYLEYYTELVQFIHKLSPSYKVILNPGIIPDNSFFTIADYIVVAEDFPDSLDLDSLNELSQEQLMKSIVIVHDCHLDKMKELIPQINTRYIYFTDHENYNELATYYVDEVIELINKYKEM